MRDKDSMKKLLVCLLLLASISTASATVVAHENVTVDLEDSSFDVNLDIRELTSDSLTYVIAYPIDNLEAKINGEKAGCYVKDLQIGSEIHCRTNKTSNFTAHFRFQASGITSDRESVNYFQYTRAFRVPTDNYRLKVVLPEDSGIVNDENISQPVISPSYGQTGSDGQRIFVEWQTNPRLGGEPITFSIFYNEPEEDFGLVQYIGIALLAALILLLGFSVWRRISKIDISEAYEDLDQDQKDIVELLRENEGSMLQKDVVDSSEYSKAKVSGVVSELVDKGVIEKEKEGRSNKLKISDKYSF
ncbi:hypothetical protein GKQ38_03565 [Candidatus Nanohaloarchaea archaeon]|nr:hypothetical protein GKQ38_03565 [Candidatus Nanohaloarchaea archaeon]